MYSCLFICCISWVNMNILPLINEFGASEFGASSPWRFHLLMQNGNDTSTFLGERQDM